MKINFSPVLATILLLSGTYTTLSAQEKTEALVITSTTLDQKAKATNSKVYLKEDKMVTETTDGKDNTVMLFDADTETLFIINHKKKEYTEMTREDMENLNAMLTEQLAVMEQQLAMLPEKQRDMVREQMGASFGVGQKPSEYSLTEADVSIKDWETDKYTGVADGKTQSEIYIASYGETGYESEDFASLEKFFDTMKNFMQSISKQIPSAGMGFFGENMPGYKEGIPVKTVIYNTKGEASSTTTLESISEEEVEKSVFEVPENYKMKKIGK